MVPLATLNFRSDSCSTLYLRTAHLKLIVPPTPQVRLKMLRVTKILLILKGYNSQQIVHHQLFIYVILFFVNSLRIPYILQYILIIFTPDSSHLHPTLISC